VLQLKTGIIADAWVPGPICTLAFDSLSRRLGEQRLGLNPARKSAISITPCNYLNDDWRVDSLADLLIAKGIELGGARTHDIVGRRNVLLGPVTVVSTGSLVTGVTGCTTSSVLLLSHLVRQDLAVIFHRLHILDGVDLLSLCLTCKGSIDVLVREYVGRHCAFTPVAVRLLQMAAMTTTTGQK
jgi:hypothetical protein